MFTHNIKWSMRNMQEYEEIWLPTRVCLLMKICYWCKIKNTQSSAPFVLWESMSLESEIFSSSWFDYFKMYWFSKIGSWYSFYKMMKFVINTWATGFWSCILSFRMFKCLYAVEFFWKERLWATHPWSLDPWSYRCLKDVSDDTTVR